MKHFTFAVVALISLAMVAGGCKKKAEDQASLAGTGFDTLQTEELAQLPQTAPAQQSAIEVLPIEAAPVTQGIDANTAALQQASPLAAETLTYAQKIQTALKNAGLYQGNIDGKIGPATRRAIETFQKDNGLKVDGKVGPKTWAALEPFFTGHSAAVSAESAPIAQ